jgi:hypothetical protein
MSKKYELSLINDETGETTSIAGEFSDDETRLIEEFVKEAEEVWNTEFIQSGEKGQLNIEWDRETGSKVSTVLPEWNQVIVFLYKFRPILLQNERTNFYKIHNLLAKKLNHAHFRNSLGVQHELYSGKTAQADFQIKSNQVLLNSEKVLFDWLNSHEYHRDEDKRQFIESLHQMIPLDASKVIFLRLLLHKAVAARNIADLINVVMGKEREVSVAMKRS